MATRLQSEDVLPHSSHQVGVALATLSGIPGVRDSIRGPVVGRRCGCEANARAITSGPTCGCVGASPSDQMFYTTEARLLWRQCVQLRRSHDMSGQQVRRQVPCIRLSKDTPCAQMQSSHEDEWAHDDEPSMDWVRRVGNLAENHGRRSGEFNNMDACAP